MRLTITFFLMAITSLASGCTPVTPSQPIGAPTSVKPFAIDECRAGVTFVQAKVQLLARNSATFGSNFGGYGERYKGPTPDGPISNADTALLQHVFQLAPGWFQSELCNKVDTIFVDENPYEGNNEFGWAFWEASSPPQGTGQRRFVGISQAALQDSNLSLAGSENGIILSLLKAGIPTKYPSITASFSNGGKDGPAWAILAILAHEMGHLFWHDYCDHAENQSNQRACFDGFHKYGWETVGGRWNLRHFGAPIPGAKHKVSAFDNWQVEEQPYPVLRRLYEGPTFASLFAVVAPDEDLAETYKFVVLRDARDAPVPPQTSSPQLTSLAIGFNEGSAFPWQGNIMANLAKSDLCAKAAYIESLLRVTPSCSK